MSHTITSGGLLLRPFEPADSRAFTDAVLESVPTVGRWMSWCSDSFSEQDALAWFAACAVSRRSASAFEFGVFAENSGEFLGGAGLNGIMHHHRICNLGYWVRQSRQRQGVASRCVAALSRHAFGQLDLHRVEIVVAVGNAASEGVAAKSGALRECVARNRLFIHGRSVPAHVFSLVPEHAGE